VAFWLEVPCVSPALLVGKDVSFFKKKFEMEQLSFFGQMILRLIAELLKNAPVLLQRF